MEKVYYNNLRKGRSAIDKLAQAAGASKEKAQKFLRRQKIWQIYLAPPSHVPRPHWTVDQPNKVHQTDLLFLPHDKVGRKVYKYTLVVVDVASRYKDAEPLTSKSAEEVAKAFSRVYSRKLEWPQTLVVDPGSEFKGAVAKTVNSRGTTIQRSEAGNHRAQAFVERANRPIGEQIFSHQYAEEAVTGGRSTRWVKILHKLNSTPTRLTGKAPLSGYTGQQVKLEPIKYDRPVCLKEKPLDPFALVRYLLRPGEEEGGETRRATDPIWSWKGYYIDRSVVEKVQPILYYLANGPKRSFVREELQVIPENTQDPPKWVLNWTLSRLPALKPSMVPRLPDRQR